jgi:hypothetical protein
LQNACGQANGTTKAKQKAQAAPGVVIVIVITFV